jgi:hypothetical protein
MEMLVSGSRNYSTLIQNNYLLSIHIQGENKKQKRRRKISAGASPSSATDCVLANINVLNNFLPSKTARESS